MYLNPPSSYSNKASQNRVLSSFSDPAIRPIASAKLTSFFWQISKTFQALNTLYTLNRCGLCLGTNLLSRYDNGRGKEKKLKYFSLRMSSPLSKIWVCVVENLSRFFSLKCLFTMSVGKRVYIVWVKGKKVILKNPPSKESRGYLAGRPYPRNTSEIDNLV